MSVLELAGLLLGALGVLPVAVQAYGWFSRRYEQLQFERYARRIFEAEQHLIHTDLRAPVADDGLLAQADLVDYTVRDMKQSHNRLSFEILRLRAKLELDEIERLFGADDPPKPPASFEGLESMLPRQWRDQFPNELTQFLEDEMVDRPGRFEKSRLLVKNYAGITLMIVRSRIVGFRRKSKRIE